MLPNGSRFIGAALVAMLLASCAAATPPGTDTSSAASHTSPSAGTSSSSSSPTAFPTPAKPNDYVVISQLNLWYHGPGCYGGFEAFDCSGKRTSPFEPALGHAYYSEDPKNVKQQIDWAADYGVDAFSLEWTTPSEVQGSLEPIIDDVFLKAPNLNRIRWCIYDDFVLRLDQTRDLGVDISKGIDFNNPKVYAAFVSDFGHFAQKYFGQPQYLKDDGRPIITLFADWNYQGNFAGAIKEARAEAAKYGFDPYIVGEEMRADSFDPKRIAMFDATTGFNFANPGLPDKADMGSEAISLDQFFKSWQAKIKDLKVSGTNQSVGFEPFFGPQEDNRLGQPKSHWIYVPAQSKDQVAAMAIVARDNAQPADSQGQKLIWENTWNCWGEGTTIEPTADKGAKYPAGNYGFDFLEVIKQVFGPETFPLN
jgi:Glycosyltransferase WbsX